MALKIVWTVGAQKEELSTATVVKTAGVHVMEVGMSCMAFMLYMVRQETTKKAIFIRA